MGAMRAGSHELRSAGLTLLTLLTEPMSAAAKSALLTKHRGVDFLLSMLIADGSAETYRGHVLTLLRHASAAPAGLQRVVDANLPRVLEQLAERNLLTPTEWQQAKILHKVLQDEQRVAQLRPAGDADADANDAPLPARPPPSVFTTALPPDWSSVQSSHSLRPAVPLEGTSRHRPGKGVPDTRTLAGWLQLHAVSAEGLVVPPPRESVARSAAPTAVISVCAVNEDGGTGTAARSAGAPVDPKAGDAAWNAADDAAGMPVQYRTKVQVEAAHPPAMRLLCQVWVKDVGLRPVLVGTGTLNVGPFLGHTISGEEVHVSLQHPDTRASAGVVTMLLTGAQGTAPLLVARAQAAAEAEAAAAAAAAAGAAKDSRTHAGAAGAGAVDGVQAARLVEGAMSFAVGSLSQLLAPRKHQNVFVQVTLVEAATGTVLASGRTGTVQSAGTVTTPRSVAWRDKNSRRVTLPYRCLPGSSLVARVEAWDEDLSGNDTLIGTADVDVSQHVGQSVADVELSCQLQSPVPPPLPKPQAPPSTAAACCGLRCWKASASPTWTHSANKTRT